jgi:hypothetical protein
MALTAWQALLHAPDQHACPSGLHGYDGERPGQPTVLGLLT